MRFTFNLQKRHLLPILAMMIFVGVVMGQTPPNPGHTASQIVIGGSINNNLEAWSGSVETRLTTLGSSSAFQIQPGPEVYAGNYRWYGSPPTGGNGGYSIGTSLQGVIPEYYLNGIHSIRFRWRNTGSPSAFICGENQDIICGNGNPAGPNSWSCTCIHNSGPTSSPQSSTIYTLAANGCPPVASGWTNWVTFNVQSDSGSPENIGFSSINVEFCHSSQNVGTADIDVYVTPKVLVTTNGVRIGQPNSI
jgi:hypothetical protein